MFEQVAGELRAKLMGGVGACPGFKTKHNHTSAHQAPPVWRAPEGPEGTGGLRDRPLRAAGSRVAISRAAGPDGARNTSGTTSNTINDAGRRPRAHQAARPYNTPAVPETPVGPQRNEAATGFPATASSRSRSAAQQSGTAQVSAVHNSATSDQAVMST